MQEDIRDKNIQTIGENEYGVIEAPVWGEREKLSNQMFELTGSQQRMDIKYLDIPMLHNLDDSGFALISSLCRNDDIQVYGSKAVQKIINFHWETVQRKINVYLLVPYAIQLCVFFLWSNFVLGWIADGSQDQITNIACVSIISVLSIYFLIIEFIQFLVKGPYRYFTDFWNYIEVTPLVLILRNCFESFNHDEETHYPTSFWKV